jgi:hypothetical protein
MDIYCKFVSPSSRLGPQWNTQLKGKPYISQMLWVKLRTTEVVSHRLPTAATQIRSQVRRCGICGEQSGAGVGFLQVLRFPLLNLIPPTASHTSYIVRVWYNRPNSDRRTPPQEFLGSIREILRFSYRPEGQFSRLNLFGIPSFLSHARPMFRRSWSP